PPLTRCSVHDCGGASTTSMLLRHMRGRARPSPRTRAYRFAFPGRGSKICDSIPSRASTALSHWAALSSFPGGFVVLILTYWDKSVVASRPTARHSSAVRGTPPLKSWGGSMTGADDGPMSDGRGGRAQAARTRHSPVRPRRRTQPPRFTRKDRGRTLRLVGREGSTGLSR